MRPRSAPIRSALFIAAALAGCRAAKDRNPAAPGFDAAGSDPRAVALADATMEAMGGRAAWDATRCLSWDFFGMRRHVWDKWTGDYRLEQKDRVVLMNLNTMKGRLFEHGVEDTDPARVAAALQQAKSIWINDSYWLVMPYKLKDDGVTLRWKGEDKLPDGRAADVITLTFKDVGDTPQNKYEVWISRDRHLVEQWAYYAKSDDAAPRFTTAWSDWQRRGSILLSGDRTAERRLTEIAVLDAPPASLQNP
jgi:hypothetical protein